MKQFTVIIFALLVGCGLMAQVDRTTAPPAGKAPKINIEEAQKFELKNGLKVFVVENHKNPIVSYSLSLDLDPIVEGDKAGYIEMAGDLLGAGTSNRSKAELDEAIDFIGATLNTSPSGIYASSLKKHSEEVLELLTDVLYNPIFPAEELDKLKKQSLTALQTSKDDPGAIASNVSGALLYGKDHPYGEVMTEKTIEAITLDDCKKFYTTFYRPNVAYLIIVGDISLKDAKKQAKKYFSSWEMADVPTYQYETPKKYTKPKVAVANKEGANQSTVYLTYTVDLKPGCEDEIKVKVMNYILGGGTFAARLIANLREDKAYTYGAYSKLNNDELVGSFSASAKVRTSVTDSAFTEIIYEMNRLKTEKVAEEDLQLIKNLLAGSFSRSLEDPKTIAKFALNIEKYKLPANYYQTYLEKLEAVTAEDVQAMAQKYLTPENAVILAVGDLRAVRPKLEKFTDGTKVEMYDFYGDEMQTLPVPEGVTVDDVIGNYINSIGGKELLGNVNNVELGGVMNIQGMDLSMTIYSKKPNWQCVETFMQGNLVSKQVFNGVAGYSESPMGNVQLDADMVKSMEYQARMFPELYYLEDGFKTELSGMEIINGDEAVKLIVTNPVGNEVTAYYSMQSGLKIREVVGSPQGVIISNILEYSDVDGIKLPKVLKQSVGLQSFEITFETIKVNTEIDDKKFEI